MEAKHKEQGVVLLAVSIDDSKSRPKIPAFLQKHGVRCKVLLGSPQSPKGYDTQIASTVYVVDRNGLLAGIPSELFPELESKVEPLVSDLLAGKASPGRVIYSLEKAPPGFGILWKQPLEITVKAVAVAPASGGHLAEIGLMNETNLTRYSPRGELLGDAPVEREDSYVLRGADLDGDGRNEWIVGGDKGFVLMDSSGEAYWSYYSSANLFRIAGIADLDGDGKREIVVQDGSTVVAKSALPGNLWKTPPLGALRSVVLDPAGDLLAQLADGIQPLDRRGATKGAPVRIDGGGVLKGRIHRGRDDALDLFGPAYDTQVEIPFSLAGDGREEILVLTPEALTLFSQEGTVSLRLRFPNLLERPRMAVGDLDGRPGDELVLVVPQVGLMALGISPEAKPVAPTSNPTGGSAVPGR